MSFRDLKSQKFLADGLHIFIGNHDMIIQGWIKSNYAYNRRFWKKWNAGVQIKSRFRNLVPIGTKVPKWSKIDPIFPPNPKFMLNSNKWENCRDMIFLFLEPFSSFVSFAVFVMKIATKSPRKVPKWSLICPKGPNFAFDFLRQVPNLVSSTWKCFYRRGKNSTHTQQSPCIFKTQCKLMIFFTIA